MHIMIKLNVPFSEKNQAKALGARWNPIEKTWYIPEGLSKRGFERWLPDNRGLASFLKQIAEKFVQIAPKPSWVMVEIAEIKYHGGHVYIHGVEYQNQQKIASAALMCWQKDFYVLMQKHSSIMTELQAGMKLLLLLRVEFQVLYGLRFFIEDIDPSTMLGDMQQKLQKIRQLLKDNQLINKQKTLKTPFDFFKIAVISPQEAAGLGDFRKEAEKIYTLCQFDYYHAIFQGENAVSSLLAVIKNMNFINYNCLVIIRGGGAVADLAWLNDENLAKAICLCPIPVFTGIGHQKDQTILDEVAHKAFDTPSKVIHYIIQTIMHNAQNIENFYKFIENAVDKTLEKQKLYIGEAISVIQLQSQKIIQQANQALEKNYFIIQHSTEQHLQFKQQELEKLLDFIKNQSKTQLYQQEIMLKNLLEIILGLSPQATLQRGYAIVKNPKGDIINTQAKALQEKHLLIQFYDGQIETLQVKKGAHNG